MQQIMMQVIGFMTVSYHGRRDAPSLEFRRVTAQDQNHDT